MEVITYPTNQSSLSDSGPFQVNNKRLFEIQKSFVDMYKNEWFNKKGLFVPGGVGRLTNYALSIGLDVDCMDASSVCEKICKQEYPKVNFIKANYMKPRNGYDYIFFEDLVYTVPMIPSVAYAIHNWQSRMVQVYPASKSYSVYRFNSEELDVKFYQYETTGQKYINKLLSDGSVNIYIDPNEVEDLYVETFILDLNKPLPKFDHSPYNNKKYTAIAYTESCDKDRIRLRLFCSGFHKNFQTNQEVILNPAIPERQNYKGSGWNDEN